MNLSRQAAERLRDAWPEASSLREAVEMAGLSAKDNRRNRRLRRDTEKMLGVSLTPHNPQFSPADSQVECPSYLDHKAARQAKDILVTSFTNNSPVVQEFLETSRKFIEHRNGQLLAIPVRYKNPNMINRTDDYEWPSELFPYAVKQDLRFNQTLMLSSAPIQATAANPLTGMDPISGIRSAIYGHPQLALESTATPPNQRARIMHTTGAITRPRYSSSKAGARAKFHHSLSALYVQVKGAQFFIFQLMWDGVGFYFFDEYWTPDGFTTGNKAAGMVFGDDHVFWEDKAVTKARREVMNLVRPEIHVRHDVLDFHSQSHHNTTLEKIRIAKEGDWLVENEIDGVAKYLNANSATADETWIVSSNHDEALEKWMNRFDPRQDPHNAEYYFWLMGEKTAHPDTSALELALTGKLSYPTKFIGRNSSALIRGIDCSQHGDIGTDGSRGSLSSFAKSAYKSFTGHTHRIGIKMGAWAVGVATMFMRYRRGLSSWSIGDGLIYQNGKRMIVVYNKGKFRLW